MSSVIDIEHIENLVAFRFMHIRQYALKASPDIENLFKTDEPNLEKQSKSNSIFEQIIYSVFIPVIEGLQKNEYLKTFNNSCYLMAFSIFESLLKNIGQWDILNIHTKIRNNIIHGESSFNKKKDSFKTWIFSQIENDKRLSFDIFTNALYIADTAYVIDFCDLAETYISVVIKELSDKLEESNLSKFLPQIGQ